MVQCTKKDHTELVTHYAVNEIVNFFFGNQELHPINKKIKK